MTLNSSLDLSTLARQAMLEKGFAVDFPPQIQQQLTTLTTITVPLPNVDARDMRHLLWFSIDNDDSRDLDQLTYAESLPAGQYKIYVAVANVNLLVPKNSPIDRHAAQNTTSVYTPTVIFPMLPEKLSTDLTSLNPGQDRLAMIFEGTLNNEGTLLDHSIYLGYVHNYAQLAYHAVGSWLEGTTPLPENIKNVSDLEQQIRLQDIISQALSLARHKLGALSLETIEAQSIISAGVPTSIQKVVKNRAHKLIENFMIVANTISALYADSRKLFSLRRVVVTPKYWDKIIDIAAKLGTHLPEQPDARALEQFLCEQRQAKPTTFPDLSLTIIKLLGRGEYVVATPGKESAGHFGLALKDYSHSTAPNRRFPDLITQRLLLSALSNQPQPYTFDELKMLAVRCTMKEDDAEKIERRMKKSAAALVLSNSIGKEFDGIITGASNKGVYVRLLHPPVDGKLVKGHQHFEVGDKVRVKLIYTDPRAGFIDFTTI